MAKQKKESKNKILQKIYLILLFIAGIIIAFSFKTAKKRKTI
jgi:cbb3-type cytochrome oxidase subunit 3